MRKILLASARETERRNLAGLLQFHGFHVGACANAAEAIRLGIVMQPDVLITDEWLAGETTGLAVVASLVQHIEDLLVIVTLAEDMDAAARRYEGLPVQFLPRPSAPGRLLEEVGEP